MEIGWGVRRLGDYWIAIARDEQGVFAVGPSRRSELEATEALQALMDRHDARAKGRHVPPGALHPPRRDAPGLDPVFQQLEEYLAGRRHAFDVRLDLSAGTDFQRAVWVACARIPHGTLRSYGWIAERIRRPRAIRAVGQALGANPVPILIPCHRVVRSDGSLGGYSGGLDMKRDLLALEARESPKGESPSPP
jgi:O-6-methylguanine DNA methyltransferase